MFLIKNNSSTKLISVDVGTQTNIAPGGVAAFASAYKAQGDAAVAAFSDLELLVDGDQGFVDVSMTSAELLAIFTTPKTLLPAAANFAYMVTGMYAVMTFGTAAYEAGSQNLELHYTNAAGTLLLSLTNAFLETASSAKAYVEKAEAQVVPVVNAPLVLCAPSANPTLGDGTLKVRVFFHVLPSSL
jgi:hypothetical protein